MSQASRRLPWIVVFCALAMIGGCGGAKSRFASHMHRGEQYLSAGVLDKASVEFRNALQIEPRDARARYLNGQVAEKRGNMREALGSYQGAVDVNPDYTLARAALARLLVFGGAAERALPIVEPGLAKHPEDAQLLMVRAAARAQLKNLDGALSDAQHAARVAPDDPDTVALLAALYQRQGDLPRAIDLVAGAVTRQPASIDLRHVLASLYLAAHQEAKSEEQLQKIVALAPRELPHRYELAGFYERTGSMDAAQRVLEQAVTAFPGNIEAKLVLVDFLANQRSRDQGEKTLRGYIAREPDNDQLRLGLGMLLQRAGAAQEAIASYNEVVARDPRSAAALTARDRTAAIEISRGHIEAAQKLLATVLEQSPRDTDALLMRGNLALKANKPAAAIVDLRAVLRDQPNALDVQHTLAHAYLASGEPALAEETLRAAMQSAPGNVALRLDLAQVLTQSGRIDAAVTLLEQTVHQVPSDAGAREALVRAYLAKGDLAAARTAAEDLQTLQPKGSAGPYLAGLIAERQNRVDDSRRDFEHALELQPAAVDALIALVKLQLAHDQGAAALARVRAVASADTSNPLAQNLLGEVLIATGAYPDAIAQLTKATQLAPKWPLPYRNLAVAYLDNRDAASAEVAYQAGLRATPYEPALTTGLAELYEQQGRIEPAIALYDALHAHDSRLALASNNLAMLLVTYRTDRASLDRARELTAGFATSDSGALLDTHGWVRLKLGDVSDALAVLTRAANRAPDSRVIHYHLAIAELKAGEPDKARTNLETALSGSARFTGSDDARAALNSLTGSRS